MTVALIGANGFVGTRTAELWHRGPHTLRPIVRRYAGLARLSRFDLDCRVVDAMDVSGLTRELAGCDVVINCVTGGARTIRETATSTYMASERAGVRRLVYLSSASVHGQNPDIGIQESSPIYKGQWHLYNNAKVFAESALRRARKKGQTEVVILRPGVVWGPRSRWAAGFMDDLMAGQAWIVDGGAGVLNSVNVDNLIHATDLAFTASGADGEAFFVRDDEDVTWRDLYSPLCLAAGFPWSDVTNVPLGAQLPAKQPSPLERLKSLPVILAVAPHIGGRAKRVARAVLRAWQEPALDDPYALPVKLVPALTEEFLRLQACTWRLPDTKARNLLGYRAVVPFARGLEDTISWLRWAGYPVEAPNDGGH